MTTRSDTYFLPRTLGGGDCSDADFVVRFTGTGDATRPEVWMVPGTFREAPAPLPLPAPAPRRASVHTAKISFDGCLYYISFLNRGTRSRKSYRLERNARLAADRLGEVVDPRPAKYVLPIYLDPTSETYRCA